VPEKLGISTFICNTPHYSDYYAKNEKIVAYSNRIVA